VHLSKQEQEKNMEALTVEGLRLFEVAHEKCASFSRRTGREYGIVLDAKGERIIGERAGTKNMVDLSQFFRDRDGEWVVHSHPNNSSLSPQDIDVAVRAHSTGVVAVGTDGSVFSATKFQPTPAAEIILYIASRAAQEVARFLIEAHGFTIPEGEQAMSHWANLRLDGKVFRYEYKLGDAVARVWERAKPLIEAEEAYLRGGWK
jgi:hypothetical protein